MESMRRSEANSSHHPNKVAVNSLATESNKQSSGSGSTLNNNKLSYNQQQKLQQKQQISTTATQHKEKQKSNIVVGTAITNSNTSSNTSSSTTTSSSSGGSSTSSESKDINFEYDDNEWDVGGIGDLIIDLDADIEKSSSIAGGGATTVPTVAVVGAEATPNTSVASTGGAISNLVRSLGSNSTTTTINTKNTQISILNTNEKSSSGSSSSSSSINSSSSTSSSPTTVSSSKSSSLSSTALFSPISKVLNQVCNKNQTPTINKASSAAGGIITSTTASPIAIKSTATKQQSKSAVQQQNLKLQQPSLVAQLTSKSTVAAVTTVATVPQSTESKFNLISGSANKISGQQGNNNNNSSASGIKLSTVSPVLSGSLVVGQQQQTVGTVGGNQTTAVSSSMSSQPSGGQGAGKSATKMSIDHQATLDKGLKMKIKRTKPGTKTSEAKHEIVKAEQNGTSSNPLDDNTNNNSNQSTGTTNSSTGNSAGNGNGKNKHNQQSANQQTTPTVQTLTAQQPITNTPTTTKRGSSGHRRDKTRDKTPHSRDKSEHNSNSSSGSGGSGSSNSNNSSSSSHSNSTSNSNDRSTTNSNSSGNNSCSCAHEVNGGGGIQPPCTNVSCIRNRTTSGGIVAGSLEQQSNNSNSIAQRISGPTGNQNVQNSNNSSASSNLTVNSGSGGGGTITGSGIFNNNGLIGGNTQNSGGNANAPGPPIKDGKINLPGSSINNHQQQPQQQHQSSIQIPNPTSASLTTSAQQQTIGLNPLIGGGGGSTNSQISSNSSKCIPSGLISATVHHTISVAANSTTGSSTGNTTTGSHNCDDGTLSPPAAKRIKTDPKDMVDICVGTSVGTITEPDCLGPCEPGTSVTLEGIVWHETEGGVLVVNVTWRGKTYVGTLLDCTRHDWAPPRFCDSPTEELDSRTPKGRGKRGRSANLTPDLSNFTETRSSVHSKLRNGGAKGRGGRGVTTGNATATTTTPSTTTTAVISGNGNGTTSTTGSVTSTPTCVSTTVSTSIIGNITSSSTNSSNSTNTPSTSPTAFLPPRPEKRKSKDESPSPPVNGESDMLSNNNGGTSIIPGSSATIQSTQIIVNPITGLNVQISNKKCKTASPCAISPVLLECPEQDCNKKYKHANGLRYHQSHAHGSGSMDEDSSTMPESPVIAVPPTTPSPNPPSTPQPTSQVTQTTSTTPIIGAGNNNIPVNVTVSSNGGITGNGPSPIMTTVSSSSSSGIVNVPGAITAGVPSSAVSVTPSGAGLLSSTSVIPSNLSTPTLITPIPANPQPSPSSQIPQHTIAGGSITAGISGQALSQHQQQQQQHSMLVGTVPNQGLLSGGNNQIIPEASGQQQQQSSMPAQQQHTPSNVHSNLLTTARGDGPIKPGVLRFGPTPPVDINPNLLSTQQSPLRPTPTAAMAPNSGSIGTPETAHQPSYGQAQAASQQGIPVNKSQNYGGKQKKNRKSPVPGEFDSSTSRDDVQSPAYSDISDDSTPVVEADLTDKTQSVKHPDVVKKPLEGPPPQIPQLGAYGMYQFYAQQPYMVPPQQPDHQGSVGGLGSSGPKQQIQSQQQQQQSIPSGIPNDPYNKNKEPPLDLMTKPPLSHSNNDQQQQNNGKDLGPCGPSAGGPPINLGPQNPTKPMPHFYPFNYMPPGYPYNVDPNYGPVSMVSDDNNKIGGPGQNLPPPLKDDRNKESQSPHGNLDHGKMTGQSPQIIPTKLIKNEPQLKDIKQEPNNSHSMHLKDSPVQSLSGYPGLYQRHPLLSVPQQPTPQHLSREDELRRYYIYPDQRRSSGSNNSLSLGNKDEPPSPSSLMHHQQQQSQISQQLQQSPQSQQQQQQSNSQKSSKSGSQSSNQKATNLIKDIKDEKDIKVKQEGQKPTMETQGPPPPPTSQYFLHPSYISPGPFGFDPTTHPMYRNVLMSAGPYNPPPYHLSMGRFHAPEDLSRNPGTKALDALHHAAQYYNNTQHKIHELAERAMKSPNSNNNNNNSGGGSGNNSGGSKTVNVSSPNISQQPSSGNGPNGPNNGPGGPNNGPGGPPNLMTSSSGPGGSLNLQPPPGSLGSMSGPGGPLGGSVGGGGGNVNSSQKSSDVISGKSGGGDPSGKSGPIGVGGIGGPPGSVGGPGGIGPGGVGPGGPGGPDSRSPPPQRHVHTHHHTHVGLGYPMYPAPYVSNVSAAVLASQQAAAVAVINPFPPGPTK